jgi:NAD(P)-dependent dehydrogenase (short-subunit alcohol dehydrogenase family)
MAESMANKVAWITGGGSGIGAALALDIASRGARVVVSGRREERLEAVVKAIKDAGGEARALVCDVTDEERVAACVSQITSELGSLDIVVANAGFGVAGRFEGVSTDQWKRQLDTNVIGVVNTLRISLPEVQKVSGRLAVVSSVMGKFAMSKSSPYVASKFALMGLCRCLQLELHGTGVSLTNLLPGLVSSEINQVDNDGVFHPEYEERRSKKLMWPADKAARVMADAIVRRKREYTFTGHGVLAAALGQHAPGMTHWLMTRMLKVERP